MRINIYIYALNTYLICIIYIYILNIFEIHILCIYTYIYIHTNNGSLYRYIILASSIVTDVSGTCSASADVSRSHPQKIWSRATSVKTGADPCQLMLLWRSPALQTCEFFFGNFMVSKIETYGFSMLIHPYKWM